MAITLTATALRHMITCGRLAWFETHGDLTQRAEYPTQVQARLDAGTAHETAIHQTTAPDAVRVPVTDWSEAVALTRDAMQRGVDYVLSASLEWTFKAAGGVAFTVRGVVDRLENHNGYYIPVEIKRNANPPSLADQAQLGLYVWMLSQMQDDDLPGIFWLGMDHNGRPLVRERVQVSHHAVEGMLREAARVIAADAPPHFKSVSHCKDCRWYGPCHAEAATHGHLELIYGLRSTSVSSLRQMGVQTLHEVAAMTLDELLAVHGIGKVTAPRIHASARAWVAGGPVWLQAIPDLPAGTMLDIEGDPYTDPQIPWCWGLSDTDGNATLIVVWPGHHSTTITLKNGQSVETVPDHAAGWRRVAALCGAGAPVYHWSGYDAGSLHKTAPPDVIDALGSRMHDLNRTLKDTVALPLRSTSIKVVAPYLGFDWSGYQDWSAAWQDYRQWLKTGDLDALTRSLGYQADDALAVAVVWRWLNAQR